MDTAKGHKNLPLSPYPGIMNATELTPLLLGTPNKAEYFALHCVWSVTIHFTE